MLFGQESFSSCKITLNHGGKTYQDNLTNITTSNEQYTSINISTNFYRNMYFGISIDKFRYNYSNSIISNFNFGILLENQLKITNRLSMNGLLHFKSCKYYATVNEFPVYKKVRNGIYLGNIFMLEYFLLKNKKLSISSGVYFSYPLNKLPNKDFLNYPLLALNYYIKK